MAVPRPLLVALDRERVGVSTPAWVVPVRMALGGIMLIGGVMHFTVDRKVWDSLLLNAMADSHFLWREIGIVNIVAGTALLAGRGVPLPAAILAPITTKNARHVVREQDVIVDDKHAPPSCRLQSARAPSMSRAPSVMSTQRTPSPRSFTFSRESRYESCNAKHPRNSLR